MLDFMYAGWNRRTIRLGLIVGLVITTSILTLVFKGDNTEPVATVPPQAVVTVQNVGDIGFQSSFEAIGTVQAVSEARLQTEAGGRITSVNVEIGQQVRAGAILATLENRGESAALLQAQGAYEAALAGAQAGNVTVGQAQSGYDAAKNAAINAERGAYTAVSNAFYVTIDELYGNPNLSLPGVRVNGSDSSFLNSERVAFQTILPTWQKNSAALASDDDLDESLASAKAHIERTVGVVDTFIRALNATDQDEIKGVTPIAYIATFNGLRTSLNGTLASLDAASAGLQSARENLEKAKLGGTNADVSAANAQVKIALGSLRAAQATYEKTIVRTPISGVVNALYLKAGEYASPSQAAAIVANNNGLEISTAVNLESSQTLKVGDAVTIDGSSSGVITAIGGAVDPTTGKVAIKVSVDESATLENGSTVSLAFTEGTPVAAAAPEIIIPLSALKMTGSGAVVFFVTAENTLSAQAVTYGAIKGDSVVITEGLTELDAIVMDARGLKDGQAVTVRTN